MAIATKGNGAVSIGTSPAKTVSDIAPGLKVIKGHAGRYASQPWEAYSGMFGVYTPSDTVLAFSLDLGANPSTFPNGTVWSWDISPDPRNLGIEGYMALSYGNYDGNSVTIPGGPKQVKNITTFGMTPTWTMTGNGKSGLLSETWLTTTQHTSGGTSQVDGVFEVGFFPHCSPASAAYAAGATQLGSYTDINSISWNVFQAVSGVNNIPYLVATRPGYVDYQGYLDYKSLFNFLIGKGKITGNEWMNGAAFGVECYGLGAASLTINTLTANYT